MCTVLLPPGVNPIAVNKYIISYQYIWPSKKLRVINQMSEFSFQFGLTLKTSQYRSLQRRGTTASLQVFRLTKSTAYGSLMVLN